jgi:hypothetical protein
MPAMPSNSDSLFSFPLSDITPERVYAAGDFMTWHARVLNSGP